MADISKKIPSQKIDFLDANGKPTKVWYNFIELFAQQTFALPVGSGIVATDGTTPSLRTISAGSNKINVSNGNGASGNPTIDVNQSNLQIANTQITGATISNGASVSGSNTGDQTITLTGDVTGTGTASFATTLADTAVVAGSYTINGQALFTVDSKGRLTSASNVASSSPLTTKGDIYTYAAADARLPVGTDTYVLTADSATTTGLKWAPAGAGTVTSVGTGGLATGGPITGAGTVTVTAATQSDMETATSTSTAVVPGVVQNHPGVAKVVLNCNGAGTTINRSYNVASIVDTGTGQLTINFTTAFSDANLIVTSCIGGAVNNNGQTWTSASTTSVLIQNRDAAGNVSDPTTYAIAIFGDQ